MSKIRSVGTKPEEQLHIALKTMGLHHKMNPKIAGMPDAIIPSKKLQFLSMVFFGIGANCMGTYQKAT